MREYLKLSFCNWVSVFVIEFVPCKGVRLPGKLFFSEKVPKEQVWTNPSLDFRVNTHDDSREEVRGPSNWDHLYRGGEFILVLDRIERLYPANVLVSVQFFHHSERSPVVSASVFPKATIRPSRSTSTEARSSPCLLIQYNYQYFKVDIKRSGHGGHGPPGPWDHVNIQKVEVARTGGKNITRTLLQQQTIWEGIRTPTYIYHYA